MDFRRRGRTALIAGASKGTGLATAAVITDEGCNLVLVSRTAADLAAAKEKIAQFASVKVTTHALDAMPLEKPKENAQC